MAEKRDGVGPFRSWPSACLQLEVDDLLPLVDAAVQLGIVELAEGGVRLTPLGRDFATTILRSRTCSVSRTWAASRC